MAAEMSPLKRALIELRSLREELHAVKAERNAPIAIVGAGLRFPGGADSLDTFWDLLLEGRDAIAEIPESRWRKSDWYDERPNRPGKMTTRFGGFLPHVDQFAARFFAISPREAAQMDPQQRLLLMTAWEALEDAAIAPDALAGSATGVFIGMANSDYSTMLKQNAGEIDLYFATGGAFSVAAGRIAYLLGLQGPALAIDTACSSSLMAVHLACDSLRRGECDLALAGGVNLILSPEYNVAFSHASMMSEDGRCKTFDEAADGYVRSEGCGVVTLRRLDDALAAGDDILAVIRGSAANQDGRSGGLTAPNGPAQEAVMRTALANARVKPEAVLVVETHGTGTPLGDPIEVHALGNVYCKGVARPAPLHIGSVKTNLGHTESAAGVAGLLKLALALKHGIQPPHLHLQTPSPQIDWSRYAINVPVEPLPLPTDAPRLGAVSAFGFSGTNVHLILEAPPVREPVREPPTASAPERQLGSLSAKTESALRSTAARLGAYLSDHNGLSLAEVVKTLNTGRAVHSHRAVLDARSVGELAATLEALGVGNEKQSATSITRGQGGVAAPEVVFLYTGHGATYPAMGRALYEQYPLFRDALAECDALVQPALGVTITDLLYHAPDADARLRGMTFAQPALFALQYALTQLWSAWGVQPSAVAGHSAGEYAAAVAAGALTLADGMKLVMVRGALMDTLPAGGEMVALFLDEATVSAAIAEVGGPVSVAALNGPTNTVISGTSEAVQGVIEHLALPDSEVRRLEIAIAAHSPLIDPILPRFQEAAASIAGRRPQITLISSLHGRAMQEEASSAQYWRDHLRQPVRFTDVFNAFAAMTQRVYVEIGPHPVLIGAGKRMLADPAILWVGSLRQEESADQTMRTALASLFTRGVEVRWDAVNQSEGVRRVRLPVSPWETERYWAAPTPGAKPAPAAREAMIARVAHAARRRSAYLPADMQIVRYEAYFQRLNAYAAAAILDALRALALFAKPGEARTIAGILADCGIDSNYAHLMQLWLDDLAQEGLLRTEGETWIADTPLPAGEGATAENSLAEYDELALLTEYVVTCGRQLVDVLTGVENALNTLFPNGSFRFTDFLYRDWAAARYFNALVGEAMATAQRLRTGNHGGAPLRVLEVGAGTGGTAAAALDALQGAPAEYTYTDLSDFFLARAAERFADYPFVRYAKFNAEEPPASQGYATGAYDVVLAANVIHATRDLDAALQNLYSLLAPGGIVILYETVAHPRWLSISTSLIEGWQRFDDQWRNGQPLISTPRWVDALTAHGFAEVTAFPPEGSPLSVFGQGLLIAGKSAQADAGEASPIGVQVEWASATEVRAAHAAENGTENGTENGPEKVAAQLLNEPALDLALRDALPEERIDHLVTFVRGAIARVLRSADALELRRDQPLLEMGFDSLMAVELRDLLRQGIGVNQKLPATLVFDYPNVEAIARYLDGLLVSSAGVAGGATESSNGSNAGQRATHGENAAMGDIAEMSDDEVETMLLARLQQMKQTK